MSAYTFRLNGPITPYVRMTRRGKYVNPRAQAYLVSQEALRWQLKAQMARNGWEMLGKRPLSVTIHFGYVDRRADLDNLAKAVLDACNGIVWEDDRWINALIATRSEGNDDVGHNVISLQVC